MKTEFGDYDEMYGSLDYEGAIVLDVGADYGTTAQYFLDHGARHVYCSERNEEWIERLSEFADTTDEQVAILPPMTAELMDKWLRECRPDVVKIDCEGCERHLLSVAPNLIAIPDQWVLETHTRMMWDELRERFRLLGYRLTTIHEPTPMRTNPDKVVGLFTAVKS